MGATKPEENQQQESVTTQNQGPQSVQAAQETFVFLQKDKRVSQWTFKSAQEKQDSLLFLRKCRLYEKDIETRGVVLDNESRIVDGMVVPKNVCQVSGLLMKFSLRISQMKSKFENEFEKMPFILLDSQADLEKIEIVIDSLVELESDLLVDVIPSLFVQMNQYQLQTLFQKWEFLLNNLTKGLRRMVIDQSVREKLCLQILKLVQIFYTRSQSESTCSKSKINQSKVEGLNKYTELCQLFQTIFDNRQEVYNILRSSLKELTGLNESTLEDFLLFDCLKDDSDLNQILFTALTMLCDMNRKGQTKISYHDILVTSWFIDEVVSKKVDSDSSTNWMILKLLLSFNQKELSDVLMWNTLCYSVVSIDDPFQNISTIPSRVVRCFEVLAKRSDFYIPTWQFFWRLIHLSEEMRINAVSLIESVSLYCSESKCNDQEGTIVYSLANRDNHIIRYIDSNSVIDLFEKQYVRLGLFLCNLEQRFFNCLIGNQSLIETVLVSACSLSQEPLKKCRSLISKLSHLICEMENCPIQTKSEQKLETDNVEIQEHFVDKIDDANGDVIIDIFDSVPVNVVHHQTPISPALSCEIIEHPVPCLKPITVAPMSTTSQKLKEFLDSNFKSTTTTSDVESQWPSPKKNTNLNTSTSDTSRAKNKTPLVPPRPNLIPPLTTSRRGLGGENISLLRKRHSRNEEKIDFLHTIGNPSRIAFSYIPGATFDDDM